MIIIYTTFSDKKSAKLTTRKILEQKLASCVQIFPIESAYWWKGKIEEAAETAVFIKTKKSLQKRVTDFISKNHPYEVPEIVSITPADVNKPYFDWIEDSV
ncbi:MAG: divalent-cation tolerance protein CutA [Candidatus Woykebacteria bacterium]